MLMNYMDNRYRQFYQTNHQLGDIFSRQLKPMVFNFCLSIGTLLSRHGFIIMTLFINVAALELF